ncbi:MAG: ABC transporter permease subunit [Anaerotruncus massiliensis (ex Togo et al. 2019)]
MNSRTAGRMRGLLFILPSLLGVGVFVLAPFLEVVRRSFTGAMNGAFVGLKNYADVFSNGAFRLAAGNTLRFVAFCMPLLISLSLLVAVILYGNPRRAGFFKTTFLIPMAIPVASIVLIWKALFHADGLVNSWITALGGQGTDWMQSSAAFWVLVGSYIWKNLGYDVILWMAGLANISTDIYEAAAIDGAGAWTTFTRVTLPNLLPSLYTITVLSFLNSFKVFREAYLVAGDYPHSSMYLLQHLFSNWFRELSMESSRRPRCSWRPDPAAHPAFAARGRRNSRPPRAHAAGRETKRQSCFAASRPAPGGAGRGFPPRPNFHPRKEAVMRKIRQSLPLLLPLVLSAAVWLPIVFLVGGSFMGEAELTASLAPVLSGGEGFARWDLIPLYPTLRPYVELLLDSPGFFVMFWNSVKITLGTLAGQLLVGVPAAWGFARHEFPCKNLLFTLYIVLMLMPFQVTMMPTHLVLDRLNLLDTLTASSCPPRFPPSGVHHVPVFQGIPQAPSSRPSWTARELASSGRSACRSARGVMSAVLGFLTAGTSSNRR